MSETTCPLPVGEGKEVGGAAWAVAQGYGTARDLEHIEENGCLQGAQPEVVSAQALEWGAHNWAAAVTYHQLAVAQVAGRWQARVIFDL